MELRACSFTGLFFGAALLYPPHRRKAGLFMTLRDLMMLYGVTLGKRRTKREKFLFAKQIGEAFPPLGFPVQVHQRSERFFQVENLIAGDLATAEVVFVAPFDTPAKTVYPANYYPFHPAFTVRENRRDIILQFLLSAVCVMGAYLALRQGLATPVLALRIAAFAAALALALAGVWRLFSHSNPYNFNRASASIAVMAKLAEELSGNKKVAFAFCDRAATTYEGYKLLAQNLPGPGAVILLDCIADGEKLALAHSKFSAARADQLIALLGDVPVLRRSYEETELGRNVLSILPTGLMLTSGSVEKGEFVVRHTGTKRDVGLNLPRLEQIEQALAAFARAKKAPQQVAETTQEQLTT